MLEVEKSVTDTEVRVFCIGDPHFKVSNVREMNEMTERVLNKIRETQPNFIVCLGDILDRHSNIHVVPLTMAMKFLKELSMIKDLYIVIGNHDRPNNSNFCTEEHPFIACKFWERTVVIDTTMMVERDDNKFIFVPYVPPGRFMEAIRLLRRNTECQDDVSDILRGVTCIFAHQEFYGAKMEEGIESSHGDHWPVSYPLCISGHIHHYDDLQSNMIYVGTPMQHEYNDMSTKTVSMFKFKQNEFEHERFDLGLTRKYVVHLRAEEVSTYEPPKNTLVVLVICGTQPEIDVCKKIQRIKEFQKSGIKVKYKTQGTSDVLVNVRLTKDAKPVSYIRQVYNNIISSSEKIEENGRREKEKMVEIFRKLFGDVCD